VEANLCRSFVCFLNIYITVGDREINYKSKGDVWESIHRYSPVTFIFLFQARILEEFEDTKGVIRIPKSKKKDNTMPKRTRRKGQIINLESKPAVSE
jgi:hypothetical protein